MLFPNISDYKSAIAIPESFVTLGDLRLEKGLSDDVYFSSGNFGVVFKMRDTQAGKLHAVKCFTREQERRTESLDNISQYLSTFQSPYIVPYTFLKDEIWVNDAEYPFLLMDWVDGVTLGEKVKTLCAARDTVGLHRLTVAFAEMALWLLEQDWAHGDLKHDNIMVRPDDSLALVDYDGCFVPSMSGQVAREIGSPCYRHPKRTAQHFDKHIDDFSILVIFLSLRALSQNPDLFETHQNGENLLFSVADLAESQGSVLLGQLRRSADTYIQGAVGLLDFSVAMGSLSVFGLRDGVLRVFFEGFKGDLLPKKVILRCINWEGKEVVFEVERDTLKLELRWKGLKSLSDEIGRLTNLTKLDLSYNELKSLPVEMKRLTNLKELNLRDNQLTSLPAEIGHLTNLTLKLDTRQLVYWVTILQKIPNLKLDLANLNLTSLPAEIGRLTNLTTLDLRHNRQTNLPAEIEHLNNLTTLDLRHNQLTSLSAEIGYLINLTWLGLEGNQLISLPTKIGRLTNLRKLSLYNNQLTSLPAEIGRLTNLTELGLYNNRLTSLPAEIGCLTSLTELNLRNNRLTSLPAEIELLTSLTELNLWGNQLSSLPNEIGQLKNLTSLHLGSNQLTSLPNKMGQLRNLTTLSIGYNKLTSLPDEIGQLTNLTRLSLSRNQLSSLPKELSMLKNLTVLYLENNLLTHLPNEIGQLKNLTSLDLRENQLSSLPAEIGRLTNLTKLDLRSNKFSDSEKVKIKQLLPKCAINF